MIQEVSTMTLPNFFLAGAPKSGTSSLHHYLRQHPEVFVSAVKEPRYFLLEPGPDGSEPRLDPDFPHKNTNMPIRTMEDYVALFDGVDGQKAIGESSPVYIYSPVAMERIHELIPDAKFLFTLRNPVARAFSNYQHAVRQGKEQRPVEEALVEGSHYLDYGRYNYHLSRWYDTLDPSQMKVVLFDDLKSDTLGVYQEICRFLGISDTFVPDFTVRMKGGKPKNKTLVTLLVKMKRLPGIRNQVYNLPPATYQMWRDMTTRFLFEENPPIPEALQQRLSLFYRDDITALESLLGRDLSAWKK